jgi:hypothetical protein
MFIHSALYKHLSEVCPDVHAARLHAVIDVAKSLEKSQSLALTSMGRHIDSTSSIKHRVKKVDRLESNVQLYKELHYLYQGLSEYVFTYISQTKDVPIVIDLCYMKDDKDIQMLSAELATRGRTLPLYREIFGKGELTKRASSFITALAKLIPEDREVICIMDAGFHEDWFKAIESTHWFWLVRSRKPSSIKFSGDEEWTKIKDFIPTIGARTKEYEDVLLYRNYSRSCRLVTTHKKSDRKRTKTTNYKKNRLTGSGKYLEAAREPWILATNLPSKYKATQIVTLYSKRMQIEESFRDLKSHQFGLSGRNVRTTSVHRWGVKMLLAAIVQIVFWAVGIVAHSQGLQKIFQANTVKDRKVFSNFTLGKLIIEFDKLHEIKVGFHQFLEIIQKELTNA